MVYEFIVSHRNTKLYNTVKSTVLKITRDFVALTKVKYVHVLYSPRGVAN